MLKSPLHVRRVPTSLGQVAMLDHGPTTPDGLEPLDRATRTVVLLHGLPTCKELWADVVRALPRDWHVVAPDLPGYGASARTDGPITHRDRALAVREALAAVGVGIDGATFDLVGHDLGASVVVQYLGDHGAQDVRRVGLVSAPVYPDFRRPLRVNLVRARGLGEMVAPMAKRLVLTRSIRDGLADPDRYDGSFALAMQDAWEGPDGTRALLDALRWGDPASTFADYPRILRHLLRPTLVVHGRRDPWIPAEHAERLARDVPDAELRWLDDVGHFVPADAPRELADLLVDFLGRE